MLSNEDWSYPEGGRCSCGTEGGEEVRRGEEGEEGGRGEGRERWKRRGREVERTIVVKRHCLHVASGMFLHIV